MADMQEAMSKSAKRRAAKKAIIERIQAFAREQADEQIQARDAAGQEEEEAPAPTPTPKEAPKPAAKGKAKAATPTPPEPAPAPKAAEPKGKAKAKAEPKAKAKAEPTPEPKAKAKAASKAEPTPEPKAKAKADAKAKAAVAEQPKALEQPKAQPKAKEQPKAATKAKAKAKAEEPPKPKEPEPLAYIYMDDGKGGDWEEASGKSKQQEKQERKKKQKEEEEKKKKAEEEAEKKAKAEAEAKALAAAAKSEKKQEKKKAKEEAKGEVTSTITMVVPEKDTAPPTSTAATTKDAADPDKPTEPPDAIAVVTLPENTKMGRLIGPGGSNFQKIKEVTGIKKIDTSGNDTITITGAAEKVVLAEAAIKELLEKGYMQISYQDFAEGHVMIHPSSIADIIGKSGAVINEIKNKTKVEIKMPEVPRGGKDGFGKGGGSVSMKKEKIEIVGDKENVDQAKEIINSILMYGHHEVTHPDDVHEEMDIPKDCYGFIIGRGGQELRHIQNNFTVRVNIPRETSVNDKVVIIGDKLAVERAVTYINKLMASESEKEAARAEKEAKGKGKGDSEKPRKHDPDDDDGPIDPELKRYIKVRK